MSHLAILATMPTKHLHLRARDTFPRLLIYLRLLFYPKGIPPSGDAQHGWCGIPSCAVGILDHLPPRLPEIDLFPMNDPGTPPEHLVDAVRDLRPFLPIGCELFGQGDLKIVGLSPVDAGGFADTWVGERDDGTKVAIKSYRYYSSSGCLPVYLVGVECNRSAFCPLNFALRGCIRKHRCAVVSRTTATSLYHSSGFIPLANTPSLSFSTL